MSYSPMFPQQLMYMFNGYYYCSVYCCVSSSPHGGSSAFTSLPTFGCPPSPAAVATAPAAAEGIEHVIFLPVDSAPALRLAVPGSITEKDPNRWPERDGNDLLPQLGDVARLREDSKIFVADQSSLNRRSFRFLRFELDFVRFPNPEGIVFPREMAFAFEISGAVPDEVSTDSVRFGDIHNGDRFLGNSALFAIGNVTKGAAYYTNVLFHLKPTKVSEPH